MKRLELHRVTQSYTAFSPTLSRAFRGHRGHRPRAPPSPSPSSAARTNLVPPRQTAARAASSRPKEIDPGQNRDTAFEISIAKPRENMPRHDDAPRRGKGAAASSAASSRRASNIQPGASAAKPSDAMQELMRAQKFAQRGEKLERR